MVDIGALLGDGSNNFIYNPALTTMTGQTTGIPARKPVFTDDIGLRGNADPRYAQLNEFSGDFLDLSGIDFRYPMPTAQPAAPTPEELAAVEAARQQAANDEAQRLAALELFNSQKSAARNQAFGDISTNLLDRGFKQEDFASGVNNILDQQFAGDTLPTIDARGISRGIISDIGQDTLDDRRAKFQAQVSGRFGPNYGDNLIDDNLANPVIEDILGRQMGDARTFVERGRKRGIYNDVGVNAANRVIDDGLAMGRSKLSTIGRDVIKGYEAQGDEVAAKAAGAASGYTLGSNFNLDDFASKGSKIASDAQTNAGNDVRAKFGGTQLFDFGGLTNAAGAAQGATGLVDGDVYAALANRKKSQSVPRGLGNQGSF